MLFLFITRLHAVYQAYKSKHESNMDSLKCEIALNRLNPDRGNLQSYCLSYRLHYKIRQYGYKQCVRVCVTYRQKNTCITNGSLETQIVQSDRWAIEGWSLFWVGLSIFIYLLDTHFYRFFLLVRVNGGVVLWASGKVARFWRTWASVFNSF